MATGDQYRRIQPDDQLIFDSTGALIGVRSGRSTATELRGLTATQLSATQAMVSRAGNRFTNRPRYVTIGNSISTQSGQGYGVAYSWEYYSHMQWVMALTDHPFQPVPLGPTQVALPSTALYGNGCYGWSGATSAQIAGDLPNFIALTGRFDVAFIHAMENDAPNVLTLSVAQATAAYDSIIEQCVNAGASLIYWVQALPNIGINTAGELAAYWAEWRYMEAAAARWPQLRLVPTYDLWTDTSGTYPVPLNAGAFSGYTDGAVHPRKGGYWLGRRIADVMARDGYTYTSNPLDLPGPGAPGWIAGSAAMVGTGGTFTGYTGTPSTPPAGLTVSTNMASVSASTADAGRSVDGRSSLNINVAAAAQSALNNAVQISMAAQTTGFAVGDTVQLLVEAWIDPAVTVSGIRGLNLELRLAGASGSAFFARQVSGDANLQDLPIGVPFMMATPIMQLPAGTTSIRPFFTAVTSNTATIAVALQMRVLSFRVINWSAVG